MSRRVHPEKHFTASDVVRDVVIGMSDGLTVPFALAAGLSGAIGSSGVVITAGCAEIAAGAIAMGLGGYLAARTEAQHYATEREREHLETIEMPDEEAAEVAAVFRSYGVEEPQIQSIVTALRQNRGRWVDFMMRFELGLEEPDPRHAAQSATRIGLSYIAGGLVPLAPYFLVRNAHQALPVSACVTAVALFAFGYVKGHFTSSAPLRSAFQTAMVGVLAAGAAFAIARAIS